MKQRKEGQNEKGVRNPREEKTIDFKKIGAIIQKNFIVMIRDKTRLIPLMIFPIAMILVLGFASGNTPKHISAAIITYDNSPLSQDIQQAVANSQYFTIRRVVSTEGEGKNLLDNGIVRVLIEIPPKLQDDVNNNVPAGITVIVDESDSAVAMTSRQVLNGIISQISSQISAQKISGFQQSISVAAQRIEGYSGSQPSQYAAIEARTAAATQALKASQSLIDQQKEALSASLPAPMLISPRVLSQNDNSAVSSNNTIVEPAFGTEAASAQIAGLSQSSRLIGSAMDNLQIAIETAKQADQRSKMQQQQAYTENVAKPMAVINVFTHSKTSNLLTPLTYQEKPAYGTGRQPIDFLIPSLIALTLFQGAVMGMGRSVAGEKRDGSLTRVFLTPTSNVTIILGTLSFYVLFELVRATFLLIFSMIVFNVKIEGSLLLIAIILVIYISISAAIGMMLSTLVKTEQQYMAMAMIVSLPTMFLSGAFFPLQSMPKVLQSVAVILPVTYASDALRGVMVKGFSLGFIAIPLLVLILFMVLAVGGVLVVFKRNIE
jgi:ABC-type multidrug transport system permease subunit